MTISNTTNKNTYSGDDSTTSFAFAFPILAEGDLLVEIKDTLGVITTQAITTNYTVNGTGNDIGRTNYTSGNVEFVVAPVATDTVIIKRAMTLTQSTDYIENDTFPAETHEEALDKLTLVAQELDEVTDRALVLDSSISGVDPVLPTPLASAFIRYNEAADGFETVVLSSGGLSDIVFDVTPQLGGNLDTNGFAIDAGLIRADGDTDTSIEFTTATITFDTSGSNRMDITDNGVKFGNTGSRIIATLDEDNMASDSNVHLATQQSIKAYTDTQVATKIGNVVEDTTPQLGGNLDVNGNSLVEGSQEVLTFTDNTSAVNQLNIANAATGNSVLVESTGDDANVALRLLAKGTGTVHIDDTLEVNQTIQHRGDTDNSIAFTTDTQTFQTGGGTRMDLTDSGMQLGAANARVTTILDEDTMSSDSATSLATQQSIKAYTDAQDDGWRLLTKVTASGDTSIDLESLITGTYDRYILELNNVLPVTGGASLLLRTSNDNGSTYDSSNYMFTSMIRRSDKTTSHFSEADFSTSILLGHNISTVAGDGVSCSLHIALDGATHAQVHGVIMVHDNDDDVTTQTLAGTQTGYFDVDALRLVMSSGNIDTGTVRLYGKVV